MTAIFSDKRKHLFLSGPYVSLTSMFYVLTKFIKYSAIEPVESDPCDPNPCGQNSNPPRSIGDRCQCSCLPEMIGSPPNCRPECVVNSDCPSDKACINRKCQDPCPGLCGINANCNVRNHVPICICIPGYVGDPFSQCNRPSSKNYNLILLINLRAAFLILSVFQYRLKEVKHEKYRYRRKTYRIKIQLLKSHIRILKI